MSDRANVVRAEARIAAPPERVFVALTEARQLERWLCDQARSEPRPGGELWMRRTGPHASPEAYQGRYLEVEPARRVACRGGHAGYPAGDAGRVELPLAAASGGTRLSVLHELPAGRAWAPFAERYREAWPRALERLRRLCETAPAEGGADATP